MQEETKLFEILVPTKFEDTGKPVSLKHHKQWDKYVLKISHGATILKPAKGYWIHEGVQYEDRVIPVRIACTHLEMKKIMRFTLEHYRQLAVMAYVISEKVLFIPEEE